MANRNLPVAAFMDRQTFDGELLKNRVVDPNHGFFG
jgi:hypothetical protein